MADFFSDYKAHLAERAENGVPPLPLSVEQVREICRLLTEEHKRSDELLTLLSNRVNPGVDPAARIKADFLTKIALGIEKCAALPRVEAARLLGTMLGGYNLDGLIKLLSADAEVAAVAAAGLKKILLITDSFDEIEALATAGNGYAREVIASWAAAEWFTTIPEVAAELKLIVYKVGGEINTDDFSPASFAFTRADIPLHATCMGGALFPDGPAEIAQLKKKGLPVAFVGDVVGTGSSRKSACNSLLWHIGEDIDYIPNKRRGGVIIGGIIAPIFFNTAEDSGALPIQADVSGLKTGQVIVVKPLTGEICREDGESLARYEVKPETVLDEYRAGGRVPLIIGKQLSQRARASLGMSSLDETGIFREASVPAPKKGQGYTLAQKMVGRACNQPGILPGTACLPIMTSVGSQDTTGPMTANEMSELACLTFQADLVMQSFCHTAAYPKPSDVITHATLPSYISERQGVSLRPGDGVIHSWLNRLLIPDSVGTGGDSHTRFPLGISFPAGSGLVAFAAALGVMPLDMPESVLVRFSGQLQPGITLRDIVNAIPYCAIKEGLLSVAKEGKKNIFSGRILEMEGLPDLTVEQAFELTDASAERSAAAATIKLSRTSTVEYLNSNITLMRRMIAAGYNDATTLQRRIEAVEEWIATGQLMEADSHAEYAAVIEINLDTITEPIVACPNDPDDVKLLSTVAGDRVDDVFIGSCMTNVGHFRAAGELLRGKGKSSSQLWVCPPTKMDATQLRREGYYSLFSAAGARIEMPGCSLCMGNQARVDDGVTVFSTSTRNFNNRMGNDAQVYLGSPELAAAVAVMGKIPTPAEYREFVGTTLDEQRSKIYRYLNFHLDEDFSL